jgi:hypothetical protein
MVGQIFWFVLPCGNILNPLDFSNPPMDEKKESVELICPKCKRTEIVLLPVQEFPKCPVCNVRMIIRELLKEGKSY